MATMIYGEAKLAPVPDVDLLTLLFDSELGRAKEHTALHAEARDPLQVITKARARELVGQMAFFLRQAYGVGAAGPGRDVVVTVSGGQSALACLFYAVVAAEGVYSAASASGTAHDVARQLRDGPAVAVVCSEDVVGVTRAAAAAAGLPESRVLVLRSHPGVELESVDGTQRCDFAQSLAWPRITDPRELADRTICILYSSGTTGLPKGTMPTAPVKGVLLSHANIVAATVTTSAVDRPAYDEWHQQGRGLVGRTLGHLPPAHVAGILGYFVRPIYEGWIVYWMPRFDLGSFVRYVAELGVTVFFTVPPILAALSKHPDVTDQLARVRRVTAGAAPLSRELQAAASDKFAPGVIVTQAWGLSETTGAVTHTPLGRTDTVGSLGPLLPHVMLRLVDDDDRDVAPGQPGEALVRGPSVTKGYHNNPEANREAFTRDGWYRTGDVLRMDGDLLFLVDRKKELIKYKGLQVAPAELEGVLLSHPAVADAAVIGLPQHDTEVPRAYVVLGPGAPGHVSEADVVDYVRARVAGYKQLRGGVVFVDAVPRSPAGKILRKRLREMQQKAMAKL